MHHYMQNQTIRKIWQIKLLSCLTILKSENKAIGGTEITIVDRFSGIGGGGIWINEAYQGHGYGAEAFGARVKHAFEVLELRRLENGYFRGNEKSRRMQLTLGYKDEGIRRQRFRSRATGKLEDECITGLLKEEWMEAISGLPE